MVDGPALQLGGLAAVAGQVRLDHVLDLLVVVAHVALQMRAGGGSVADPLDHPLIDGSWRSTWRPPRSVRLEGAVLLLAPLVSRQQSRVQAWRRSPPVGSTRTYHMRASAHLIARGVDPAARGTRLLGPAVLVRDSLHYRESSSRYSIPLDGKAWTNALFDLLDAGGAFLNLEHVASPTERLHDAFLAAIAYTRETEDRSNVLLDVETQLRWLGDIGFDDVDCHWKWRELALLGGVRTR